MIIGNIVKNCPIISLLFIRISLLFIAFFLVDVMYVVKTLLWNATLLLAHHTNKMIKI